MQFNYLEVYAMALLKFSKLPGILSLKVSSGQRSLKTAAKGCAGRNSESLWQHWVTPNRNQLQSRMPALSC